MKLLSTIFFLIIAQGTFAQLKMIKLTKSEIPKSIRYVGQMVDAASYSDDEGEHVVITTETSKTVVIAGDSSYTKADVYAYNYIVKGGQPTVYWQMHDFSIVCPVDTKAEYVPNTFSVTDLNNDGKAEVWLMYIVACRGGVDPAGMKIIMHEGTKKYAMRGSNRVKITDKAYEGGESTLDGAFKTGLPVFKQYAMDLWKKNKFYDGN